MRGLNSTAQQFLNLLKGKPCPDSKRKALIVGIGNTLKGDDGVGIVLLQLLKDKVDAVFMDCGIAPENYLGKMVEINPQIIIVIDAVELHEIPGTMQIIEASELVEGGLSTHSLSPGLFIDYLQNMLSTVRVFILAVQPKKCSFGEGLSTEVSEAVTNFVNSL